MVRRRLPSSATYPMHIPHQRYCDCYYVRVGLLDLTINGHPAYGGFLQVTTPDSFVSGGLPPSSSPAVISAGHQRAVIEKA